MTKQFLNLLAFAPADNGSGGAVQDSGAAAPAAPASNAPAGLSLADLAASFGQPDKTDDADDEKTPAKEPSASAEDAQPEGSDALGEAEPDAADADAEGTDAEEVAPPEGVTPERAAEMQKGIDKLKARAQKAATRATEAEAKLAEIQKQLDELKGASDKTPEQPAPASPPVADPLFLAESPEQIDAIVEGIDRGIALGEKLLKRLETTGEDEVKVNGHTLTRDQIEADFDALRERSRLVRKAERHLEQRSKSAAEAARTYPELFAGAKPKPAVQAVLNEIPELQARANGVKLAAEIASARAARAAKAPSASKPAAAGAAPTKAAAPAAKPPPVPGAVAAPSAIPASRNTTPQSLPAADTGKGLSVNGLAGLFAKAS